MPSISSPFKHGLTTRDDVKMGSWELAEVTQLAFDCRQTIIQITQREIEDVLR